MADVTAAEITRMRTIPHYGASDILTIQVFINHTFVTNDEITAAVLGVEGILGVLGSTTVDSGGGISSGLFADLSLNLDKQLQLGDDLDTETNIITDTEDDDFITALSGLSTDIGLYLTLLVTT